MESQGVERIYVVTIIPRNFISEIFPKEIFGQSVVQNTEIQRLSSAFQGRVRACELEPLV